MKNIFLLGIILLLFPNYVYLQTLSLVATKEFFDIDFSTAKQLKLQFSNGQTIGSYLGIPIIKEIDQLLKKNSIDPSTTSLLISFENNQTTKYYTYFDFSDEIAAISPYLITQQKIQYRMNDTIQYQTKGGKKTLDMDFSELTEQVFSVVVTNVKLQFKNMNAKEQQNIFSKASLIFPTDKTANRWLSDLKRLKIYKINS